MFISRMGLWGTGHLVTSSPTKQGCLRNLEDPTQSDVRIIDSGIFEPKNETETLRQFLLDAPRIDVTIDGRPWTRPEDPSVLLDNITSLFPKRGALLAAEFCTQTALAPFFCSVKETLSPEMHFVDGGRQTVRLDSDTLLMEAEKPFKVVDFDDHMNPRVLFVVTLFLYINLMTGNVHHRFSKSSLVEKDWVYVDDTSPGDDEPGEFDGLDAEDVAASALRVKNQIS